MSAAPRPLLFELVPPLARTVPFVALGAYPTPLEPAAALGGEVFIKREDLSSPLYGGNKIRTLEVLFAEALRKGARRIWSTGAFGSNHAVAGAVHAPRAGLLGAALLFPQPASWTAAANFAAVASVAHEIRPLRSMLSFPLGMLGLRWAQYEGRRDAVMAPGGATPLGAIGHVGAALELATQLRGLGVWPRHLVVPIGSTCTTAGLLVGLQIAAALGLWPQSAPLPRLHAIRVTPWPVTARFRVLSLARRTHALFVGSGGPEVPEVSRRMAAMLEIDGSAIGRGYGFATPAARQAIERFATASLVPLDTTYAGKAGAALLRHLAGLEGPVVFWSTKSSAPLPALSAERLSALPRHARRWLSRAFAREPVGAPSYLELEGRAERLLPGQGPP